MARGKSSGHSLSKADVPIIRGMQNRGDRDHDIAAWFGVNQGRVAEAKDGKYGADAPAPSHDLPPKGPPGIKGRRLRAALDTALDHLANGDGAKAAEAMQKAKQRYDANET
jgi:hypothetical protein